MTLRKLVMRSARTMGAVLGLLAMAAGAVIVLFSIAHRGSLQEALETVHAGLENARSAVEAVSSGASSSTDLVSRVRESLEAGGDVLSETADALQRTRGSVDRLRSLSATAADELAGINERATIALGRNSLGGTIVQLQQSGEASRSLSRRLDTLRVSILYLREDVVEVASAVESLQADMFSTEAAFGRAEEHLSGAAEATRDLSGSGALFWMLAGLGCVIFLAGLHLVLLSSSLADNGNRTGGGGGE